MSPLAFCSWTLFFLSLLLPPPWWWFTAGGNLVLLILWANHTGKKLNAISAKRKRDCDLFR